MRPLPTCVVSAVAVLFLASCATGGGGTSSPGGEEPAAPEEDVSTAVDPADEPTAEEHLYQPHAEMSVELTIMGSDDGGRHTPFFSGYGMTVEFDHADQSSRCTAQLPEGLPEFPPEETHVIVLECDEEIVVPVAETGFTALERDRRIGEGDVVFTEVPDPRD